jgi:putative RNA 2'-phosphotransferase
VRHRPEAVGLSLDSGGWVDVGVLLKTADQGGRVVTREHLKQVVVSNEKQRFVICDGNIQAHQGHSFAVELGLFPTPASNELCHGTVVRFLAAIMRDGLRKRTENTCIFRPMLRPRFQWVSDAVRR